MIAEKWDAFTHRLPGQTSLVVATFARAPAHWRVGAASASAAAARSMTDARAIIRRPASSTMARHRKPAHVGT